MPNKKISDLPAATQANLTDLFEKSDQGGAPSQKVTGQQLKTLINTSINPQAVNVVIPTTGAASNKTPQYYFSAPLNGVNEVYPVLTTLDDYQNFVIQDKNGNNLFGFRNDTYGAPGTTYSYQFGSPGNPIVDVIFWMASGVGNVIDIVKNNSIKDGYQFSANGAGLGDGILFQVASGAMSAIDPAISGVGPGVGNGYVTVISSGYGSFYVPSLVGNSLQSTQSVVIGAAAGTGGAPGVALDAKASDLSFQVTLTTGAIGLGGGVLFTVSLESFDPFLAAFPVKPVFSPANAAAALASIHAYVSNATANSVEISTNAALTAGTVYIWNFFLCR